MLSLKDFFVFIFEGFQGETIERVQVSGSVLVGKSKTNVN